MPAALQITRSREEYPQLEAAQKCETNAKVKQRMLAILARWDGIPVGEIAKQQRVRRNSIRRWVIRFNEGGIDSLYDKERSGRPRKADWDQLYQDLQRSPEEFGYPVQGWNYKLVKDHLRRHYAVIYHLGSLSYIFRQLGIVSIKPRSRNYSTSDEKIEDWKKT